MALGAEYFVIPDRHLAVFQKEPESGHLSGVQAMLLLQHIGLDRPLATLGHLIHLSRQPLDEEVEPAGQVHPLFPYALQRRVEIRPSRGHNIH